MDFQRGLDLESQTIMTLLGVLRGFDGRLCIGIFRQTPASDHALPRERYDLELGSLPSLPQAVPGLHRRKRLARDAQALGSFSARRVAIHICEENCGL